MPRDYTRKPDGRRYGDWTEEDLQNAVKACEDGMNPREAAAVFGMNHQTIRNRLKDRLQPTMNIMKDQPEAEDYVVEGIISHKVEGKTKVQKYLIKWEGYEEITWEPSGNVDNSPELVDEYWQRVNGNTSTAQHWCKRAKKPRIVEVPRASSRDISVSPPLTSTSDIDNNDSTPATDAATTTTTTSEEESLRRWEADIYRAQTSWADGVAAPGQLKCSGDAAPEQQCPGNAAPGQQPCPGDAAPGQQQRRQAEARVFVEVDERSLATPLPEDFRYRVDCKVDKDLDLVLQPSIWCTCGGGVDPSSSASTPAKACDDACECLNDERRAYDGDGRLRRDCDWPIYECNSRCNCDASCRNRVVQKGGQYDLCLFATADRRWAVKTRQAIPERTFVTCFVGEVIRYAEAVRRSATYHPEVGLCIIDLDYHDGPPDYAIDARHQGNVGRFFGHSCRPNMQLRQVWTESFYENYMQMAFFTTRRVESGEELTFDYNVGAITSPVDKSVVQRAVTNGRQVIYCKCGHSNCRKVLWIQPEHQED